MLNSSTGKNEKCLATHKLSLIDYTCGFHCFPPSFYLFGISSKQRKNVGRPVTKRGQVEEGMHLAVVACGNRVDETLTMVKSAILFSSKKITFHIFAEDPLAPQFEERVRSCRLLRLCDFPRQTCGVFPNVGRMCVLFRVCDFRFCVAHVKHPCLALL